MPGIMDELDVALRDLGLAERADRRPHDRLSQRLRSAVPERHRHRRPQRHKYVLYVGGTTRGDRLNFELRSLTPREEIVPTLLPLLKRFREEREAGESFGDFCTRIGPDAAKATVGR